MSRSSCVQVLNKRPAEMTVDCLVFCEHLIDYNSPRWCINSVMFVRKGWFVSEAQRGNFILLFWIFSVFLYKEARLCALMTVHSHCCPTTSLNSHRFHCALEVSTHHCSLTHTLFWFYVVSFPLDCTQQFVSVVSSRALTDNWPILARICYITISVYVSWGCN